MRHHAPQMMKMRN